MIGKIKGKLLELNGNVGLVETSGGVSYEVYLPPVLLTHQLDSQIEMYTYFRVSDDAQILFGFKTRDDKRLFELLLSVSGVGAKIAFSVVAFGSQDEIVRAVKNSDVEYFSRIPGLGKKTAMKIILELSQKLTGTAQLEKIIMSEEDTTVVDALISLGFKAQEARQIYQKIPKHLTIEEKIREGLKLGTH